MRGHKILTIEAVSRAYGRFYLLFGGVQYFSGPVGWGSVNFQRISKQQQYEAYQKEMDTIPFFKDRSMSRTNFYRILENDGTPIITIIANEVSQHDTLPKY